MEALEAALLSALSGNNVVRLKAEETLRAATAVPGCVRCLASMVAAVDGHAEPARMMAGVLLQHWVKDLWRAAPEALLPPSDRAEVRGLMLSAMFDPRSARRMRTAAALVVALIATHDWPQVWPELLPSLLGELLRGDDATPSRAYTCSQCLLFMAEKIPMGRIPALFQESFGALLHAAGSATALPRRARRKAVAVVGTLFHSLGTLITVGGEVSLLQLVAPAALPWADLAAVALAAAGAPGDADDFALELQILASLLPAVTLFPQAVGPHLPRLMAPAWALLMQATIHHEAHGVGIGGFGGGYGGYEDESYASDGDRLGFEPLVESLVELLTAVAACDDTDMSAAVIPDSGFPPLVFVALRLAQATPRHTQLWADDPAGFLREDEEETANSSSIRASAAGLLRALAERSSAAAAAAVAAACLGLLRDAAAAAGSGGAGGDAAGGGGSGGGGALAAGAAFKVLRRGAASIGFNLADLQGVLVAAATGNFPLCDSPLVRGRALWTAARFVGALTDEQAVTAVAAAVACLRPSCSLPLRLCACRAL
ncbi:unnamed protein product, partial [Phaeothamnion confervicola]